MSLEHSPSSFIICSSPGYFSSSNKVDMRRYTSKGPAPPPLSVRRCTTDTHGEFWHLHRPGRATPSYLHLISRDDLASRASPFLDVSKAPDSARVPPMPRPYESRRDCSTRYANIGSSSPSTHAVLCGDVQWRATNIVSIARAERR